MAIIKIPQGFYNDHCERDLPTPEIVKSTKQHYWINTEDPNFAELISDARHYSDPLGWDEEVWRIHGTAAQALIKAVERQA